MPSSFRIGTAGWILPKTYASDFPAESSHLARYAQRLSGVEINSSFHRPHRRSSYERWASSVPDGFSFAVKLPKEITHTLRLANADAALDAFAGQVGGLGDRLAPLLVQLPPKFAFDAAVVGAFYIAFRARFSGPAICEPRHASWLGGEADALLRAFSVARVAAHPAIGGGEPTAGGWPGLFYLRLHGAPRMYYSDYDDAALAQMAQLLRAARDGGAACWCMFDNTVLGFATANALTLQRLLANREAVPRIIRRASPLPPPSGLPARGRPAATSDNAAPGRGWRSTRQSRPLWPARSKCRARAGRRRRRRPPAPR